MSGRIVRSHTAERVAQLLGSREGRQHLSQHGWVEGMPVVMAQPNEPLEDVMGLVSVHDRPVLVAMLEELNGELRFLHISPPNSALRLVEEAASRTPTSSLFEQAEHEGMLSFRVRYWKHSAVAHAIPVHRSTPLQARTGYRHTLPA